jgi:hypothetical protein
MTESKLGRPVTRAEALEIAHNTLERAEKTRADAAEKEAKAGLFFMVNGKEYCDECEVCAELLKQEVLICINVSDHDEYTGETIRTIGLWVNCSDLFAWGTADAEPITTQELSELYKASLSLGGVDKWCCKKRGLQPQRAVAKDWKERGLWEPWLDDLEPNKE